jgi:hypothetical protein
LARPWEIECGIGRHIFPTASPERFGRIECGIGRHIFPTASPERFGRIECGIGRHIFPTASPERSGRGLISSDGFADNWLLAAGDWQLKKVRPASTERTFFLLTANG